MTLGFIVLTFIFSESIANGDESKNEPHILDATEEEETQVINNTFRSTPGRLPEIAILAVHAA